VYAYNAITKREYRAGPASTLRVIGQQTASGDSATALASGTAKHPRALYVRVRATPSQRVSVSWSMTCSKGLGAGSRSGDFTAYTPVTRRMPFPTRKPDSCSVSATAQLDDSGTIKVALLVPR